MKTYGYVKGPITGGYYGCTAAERFYIKGGSVITLNEGLITICTAGSTSVFGFALSPDSVAAGSAVTDYITTATGDRYYVCTSPDVVFSMPSAANFAVAQIGHRYKLSNANATTIQTVANAADDDTNGVVRVVGGVVGEEIVHVQIAPKLILQAGTT